MTRSLAAFKSLKLIQRLTAINRNLMMENASLKRQVQFLAEQCLFLSKEHSRITYDGLPIYKAPYQSVEGWLEAARNGRVKIEDDELHELLEAMREPDEQDPS